MISTAHLVEILGREAAVDCIADDVTTALLGEKADKLAEATFFTRAPGVFCGRKLGPAIEQLLSLSMPPVFMAQDGQSLVENQAFLKIRSTIRQCLVWERTLLNVFSMLCGVSTLTRRYVEKTEGTKAKILATRKTVTGLRELQLYAVQCGGGNVHRRSLSDGILVKDNHLAFFSPAEAVARARAARSPLHGIEIEVDSMEKLESLLEQPPDVIMLDNLTLEQMRVAVEKIAGRCRVEVSGGVKIENVADFAALGVDYISVGALTHSAVALNLSMDIARVGADA
jgi:nicotinate-nucleotide pyrophosphorylase (carboxylating)